MTHQLFKTFLESKGWAKVYSDSFTTIFGNAMEIDEVKFSDSYRDDLWYNLFKHVLNNREELKEEWELFRDAMYWRTLLNAARLRIRGSAGFDHTDQDNPTPEKEHLHFGLEVWNVHPSDMGKEHARTLLVNYVAHEYNRKNP